MVPTNPPPPLNSLGLLQVAAGGRVVHQHQFLAGVAAVAGREPVDLVGRHPELGVDHPQRLEDRRAQVLVVRQAGHDLHQPGGDVHPVRVQPVRAGLEPQRPLAEGPRHRREVVVGEPVALAEDQIVVLEAVPDPGRVGQDVADRRWPVGGNDP